MKTIPDDIILFARKAYTKTNVWTSLQIAQWILESYYGEDMPKDSNNPFGIKAVAGQPYVIDATNEQNKAGKSYSEHAMFRRFDSIGDAFIAHANLLAYGAPYASCRKYLGISLNDYIEHFAPIYATDIHYAGMLHTLINQYNLTQYDVKIPASPIPGIIGATTVVTGGALTIAHQVPPIHHFNFQPLIFAGGGVIAGICIANIVGYFVAKHLHKKNTANLAPGISTVEPTGLNKDEIDMAVRAAMEPVIAAIASMAQTNATVTASEANLTQELADANAKIASMTQDDTDTDAAVAAAAGVNADGTPVAPAS